MALSLLSPCKLLENVILFLLKEDFLLGYEFLLLILKGSKFFLNLARLVFFSLFRFLLMLLLFLFLCFLLISHFLLELFSVRLLLISSLGLLFDALGKVLLNLFLFSL